MANTEKMTFRMEGSEESHNEGFAVFNMPPVDTSIDQKEWIEYRPVSQISSDSALEFNIPGNSMNYLSLKETRLAMQIRLLQSDNKAVSTNDKVALTNLPLHSMWSQVDLSIQQQVISSVGTNYAYRAYIDTLLGYSESSKNTQLQSQLYFKDNSGHMDDADPKTGFNLGLGRRWLYTNNGQIVDLEGPILTDISLQNRYLLNGVQVTLKLWPQKELFRLMGVESDTSKGFKVELVDAVLKVCTVKVSPGVQIGHAEALKISPALYPFEKSTIKTFSIPRGYYDMNIDDIFQGDVPSKIMVGLVSSEGYNGSFAKNPYNFHNYNCSFIGFYVDGQSLPYKPLQLNYDSKLYTEAYLSLFSSTNGYMKDIGNNITRDDYANGYCLYVFNLNATNYNETQTPVIKKGHTRLYLQFNKSLSENTTVILYAKFPSLMRIDETRSVIL